MIAKRKVFYHVFMEMSLALLVISVLFWINPPDSVKDTKEVFFVLKWFYDFLTYITPVFLENFIAYIVKVHPFIFIALAGSGYFLSKARATVVAQMQNALEDLRRVVLANTKKG